MELSQAWGVFYFPTLWELTINATELPQFLKNGKLRFKGTANFVGVRWVKIDLVGNWGNELILIEPQWSVPGFNEYFG